MQNYKTAEEMAEKWNITPRHVQHLCRGGKIDGVVKRAGSWFIPEDVQIPVKNTKSNSPCFKFVGTKEAIFCKAIEFFMEKGFNNVSLRDIASGVGIRQSTIYNHFKSKQEILDTIYDYYYHYFLENRPEPEKLEPILKNGSMLDIINTMRYNFGAEHLQKMNDITKIVFQRMAIDTRASEIVKELILDEGIKFAKSVFDEALKYGKFESFDTRLMSVFINAVRIFSMFVWIADPPEEKLFQTAEDEFLLYSCAAELIKTRE